ncbi:11397_t:CDS:2, partial [Entrophospora sp. SA101]
DDELLFNDVIVDVDDELYIIMRNENNENNEESDYYISDYDLTDNSEEAIAKQNLNSFEVLKEASIKPGAFSLPNKRPLIYSGDAKSTL